MLHVCSVLYVEFYVLIKGSWLLMNAQWNKSGGVFSIWLSDQNFCFYESNPWVFSDVYYCEFTFFTLQILTNLESFAHETLYFIFVIIQI